MKLLVGAAVALALVPLAAGQGSPEHEITDLRATASNQRVDLAWAAPPGALQGYNVTVYDEGSVLTVRTSPDTEETFLLTNGRTYVFQVAAILPDGTLGPPSAPVAATPRLDSDLAYLAAGLIAVWVGVLAYAAFLARKEAAIDRKLEQIVATRYEGRAP